jgi:polygalacturonase
MTASALYFKMISTRTFVLFCLLSLQTLAQSSRPKTCTIEPSKDEEDSSPAILAAFKNCASNSVVVFKEGADYNIFTPINVPRLTNVEIRMGGNLHLPKDIEKVQSIVSNGGKIWIQLFGSNVDYIGSKNPGNGWIDSYGQAWYDANPPGKTGLPNRPKLLSFKVNKGTLQFFKSRKPIGWCVSLAGSNIVVSDANIDAVSSTSAFPFNTDGFSINGADISIVNSRVFNGDDAITVHNGAHNFVFRNSTIGFETHGMSIGSLGKNPSSFENISNILFDDITMQGGLYAARFKSWKGGRGLIQNVTWSNIRIQNVTFPIFVTQTYQDQAVAKKAKSDDGQAVMMRDFTWSNFSGTINSKNPGDGSCVKPCWYYDSLPDLKHNEAVILKCANEKSCQDFVVQGVKLKTQTEGQIEVICSNLGNEGNPKLGFSCRNGPFTQ